MRGAGGNAGACDRSAPEAAVARGKRCSRSSLRGGLWFHAARFERMTRMIIGARFAKWGLGLFAFGVFLTFGIIAHYCAG
jgi:hypothetical protein